MQPGVQLLGHAGTIGAWALIVSAAAAAGHLLWRRVDGLSRLERWTLTIATGFALWGSGLLVMGLLGALYRGLVVAVTAVAAIGFWVALWRRRARDPAPGRRSSRWRWILVALVGLPYAAVAVVSSLYPPILWDSTRQHLPMARAFVEQHAVVACPGLFFPVLPALAQALFAWGIMVDGDLVAHLLSVGFFLMIAAGTYAYGVRVGREGAGWVAAAVWLGHPEVLRLATTAYVDLTVTALGFFGVYSLRLHRDRCGRLCWPLAMVLLGGGAAVKSSGWVLLALAMVYGLFEWWRRRLTGRVLLAGVAGAFVTAFPSHLYVWLHAGNPLWPLWNLGTAVEWQLGVSTIQSTLESFRSLHGVGNYLVLPFYFGADAGRFMIDTRTPILPIIAALPIAWVIAISDRSVRWVVAWTAAWLGAWYLAAQSTRYLLPALPLVGLAVCEAGAALLARIGVPRWLRGVVAAAVACGALVAGGRFLAAEIARLGVPPTYAGREQFLKRVGYGGYESMLALNRLAKPEDTVYIVDAAWLIYYSSAEAIDERALLDDHQLARGSPADDAWLDELRRRGVDWIFVAHDASRPPWWPDLDLVYDVGGAWIFRLDDQPGSS